MFYYKKNTLTVYVTKEINDLALRRGRQVRDAGAGCAWPTTNLIQA